MEKYLIFALIIFIAGFIQGISGFGSAMIAVSLLSVFLDIKFVIPLVALLSMVTVSILTFQLREHFEYKKVHPLVIGSVLGIPPGVLFLKIVSGDIVRILLGILLLIYGFHQLFFHYRKIIIGKKTGYVLGFFAGYLGGAFNTNGPPAILYALSQPWNSHQMKVTLTSYFFLSGLGVIGFHAFSGLTTAAVLKYFIFLVPVLIIGTLLGSRFYHSINPDNFRKFVYVLLMFMGSGLISQVIISHIL